MLDGLPSEDFLTFCFRIGRAVKGECGENNALCLFLFPPSPNSEAYSRREP